MDWGPREVGLGTFAIAPTWLHACQYCTYMLAHVQLYLKSDFYKSTQHTAALHEMVTQIIGSFHARSPGAWNHTSSFLKYILYTF